MLFDNFSKKARFCFIGVLMALLVLGARVFAAAGDSGDIQDRLAGMAQTQQSAAQNGSPESASDQAGAGFVDGVSPAPVSPQTAANVPPVGAAASVPADGARPSLLTADENYLDEPPNPLTPKSEAKEQGTGYKWAWALGGATVGAIGGYLLVALLALPFSPWLGALAGAVLLGGAAYYFLGG